MDIYNFNIGDEPFEIKIISLKNDIAQVEVNGIQYTVDIGDMGYLPSVVPHVSVPHTPRTDTILPIAAEPKTKPKPILGKNEIAAPMPGTILKINVSEGNDVSSGDILLTIEAMKMENQIKAIGDGTVTKIHVNEGDSISEGQILISLGGK